MYKENAVSLYGGQTFQTGDGGKENTVQKMSKISDLEKSGFYGAGL